MSEFKNDDFPSLETVFRQEYWGELVITDKKDIDRLVNRAPLIKEFTYPELAAKVVGYFSGESGVVLPEESEFAPNNPDRQTWYTAEGSLIVFDWESLIKLAASKVNLERKDLQALTGPTEANRLVAMGTRSFLADESDYETPDPIMIPHRHMLVAAKVGDHITFYSRQAGIGILERYKSHITCRSFRLSKSSKDGLIGKSFSPPLFNTDYVPFNVGETLDLSRGHLAILQRVNRMEILETGLREKSKSRAKTRRILIPKLGKVSLLTQ